VLSLQKIGYQQTVIFPRKISRYIDKVDLLNFGKEKMIFEKKSVLALITQKCRQNNLFNGIYREFVNIFNEKLFQFYFSRSIYKTAKLIESNQIDLTAYPFRSSYYCLNG